MHVDAAEPRQLQDARRQNAAVRRHHDQVRRQLFQSLWKGPALDATRLQNLDACLQRGDFDRRRLRLFLASTPLVRLTHDGDQIARRMSDQRLDARDGEVGRAHEDDPDDSRTPYAAATPISERFRFNSRNSSLRFSGLR